MADTDSLERIRKALETPIAWFCARSTTGNKAVFMEPFLTTNPEYVKIYVGYDWQELAVVEAGAIRSLLAREAAIRVCDARNPPRCNYCHASTSTPLYVTQPPAPVQQTEAVALRDAIAGALGDTYVCMRAWRAWSDGTMSQDDFYPAGEDADVLDSLVAAVQSATPPAPVARVPLTGEQIDAIAAGLGSQSLNVTRVHEVGGPTRTIFDRAGLIEFAMAILEASTGEQSHG